LGVNEHLVKNIKECLPFLNELKESIYFELNCSTKNNHHLMSSEMWLGAERYPVSIWCITVSAPCNTQRGHCNWDELEPELHQSRVDAT
jgi:hypothetical protein